MIFFYYSAYIEIYKQETYYGKKGEIFYGIYNIFSTIEFILLFFFILIIIIICIYYLLQFI